MLSSTTRQRTCVQDPPRALNTIRPLPAHLEPWVTRALPATQPPQLTAGGGRSGGGGVLVAEERQTGRGAGSWQPSGTSTRMVPPLHPPRRSPHNPHPLLFCSFFARLPAQSIPYLYERGRTEKGQCRIWIRSGDLRKSSASSRQPGGRVGGQAARGLGSAGAHSGKHASRTGQPWSRAGDLHQSWD